MKMILGKKVGMTQIFKEDQVVPVTVVAAGPCKVLLQRTKEKDGYVALQLGFEEKGKKYRYIKEFRNGIDLKIGDVVAVSSFQEGDKVKVSGISKGKGFQGGVRRHGFHGRNATHGVKHEERTLGSVGGRFPQRVVKGRKMPGRMGAERITTKNLEVVKVDAEHNLLVLKGAVSGRPGTLLEIRG
tara:strand:+ start:5015 stop:5569 length:555 start_codon:yes stop_codon:yes gene_type:complete